MRSLPLLIALALLPAGAGANTLKAFNGDVPFDHKKHKEMFKCADCHQGAVGRLVLDKQAAHKLCIGCHKSMGAGPTARCSECHKAS